ncbi:hypothetical protein DPMN_031642 [Dreissena polymorpha]|uniref:C-type lectin domain-containing protein n=2 Tax=Dreissena polymorpha TaxID=45954 RepID=A0A9D4M0C4_DREPO|nr:hypothetical protein DPMN_031642 [Dreissena polymorpha]
MWWVGLTNTPRQDTKDYKWTDGTAHDDTILPWKKGQPDNGGYGEHCGEFWNRELNDDNCDNKRNYICEKDKYWTIPVNTPPVVIKTNPTPPTRATTLSTSPASSGPTTTLAPPPTIFIPIATRAGVSYVSNSRNIFSAGCMSSMTDCSGKPEGDYQNCAGCSVYATCAVSGFYTRPCPQYLKWDDNLKSCQFRSSTCFGP